ncbi:MAG: dihydropteroate synthase [Solirubrobacteraceae bacterium]
MGARASEVPVPLVMGIVNVTPDSFSDGGHWLDPAAAIAHGRELVAQGAQILDIGGESTRPGAEPVSEAEELRRVVPVIEGLAAAGTGARLSIDTSKAAVAAAALDAGATIVNDVTALRADRAMAALIAERRCDVCLMHMLGEPRTMQRDPAYGDVVDDVRAFLAERLQHAIDQGIAAERIWLDPGIGFGKTIEHNLQLLRRLDELVALGRPLVVGTSRKSFLGTITGREAGERVAGTLATIVLALARGASIFRVHDVEPARDALLVAAATLSGSWAATTTSTSPWRTTSRTARTASRPS